MDILCGSTTACALLEKGKKDILLFPDTKSAEDFARENKDFEVFSEWDLSVPFQHDSPYLAGKSSSRKPGLLVNGATKAVFASRNASAVYLGGFCNFFKLAKLIRAQTKDVLLIPASLFTSQDDVEDLLCAEGMKDYLQGTGLPERAVVEVGNTLRLSEYERQGFKTASKDITLGFKINGLDSIPQVTFSAQQTFAALHPAGSSAPETWIIQAAHVAEAGVTTASYSPGDATRLLAEVSLERLGDVQTPAPSRSVHEVRSKEKTKRTKLKNVLAEVADTVQNKTAELQEKAKAVAADPKTQEAKSKLKGFFSNIVRSIKEEKEDVEQAFFHKNQQVGSSVESASVSDDPLDNILKKEVEPSPTDTISPKAESTTEKTASVQDSSSELLTKTEQTVTHSKIPLSNETVLEPREKLIKTTTQGPKTVVEEKTAQPVEPEQAAPVTEVEKNPIKAKIDAFGSNKKKKAIVLFSGGLDSTTCLYWALDQGYECEVLTVSYGQRHDREVLAAQLIARNLGVKHHLITLNLPWLATSSLVDKNQSIPDVAVESIAKAGVPSTYVPGRNLMFLSIAGSLLDSVGADAIIAGPNAIDFSGYPDCTPAFFKAAADALNRGTVRGVNEGVEVLAPLMRLSKAEIVKLASQLKVPFEQTWSCYAGGQKPCGHCDSCKLRAKGFEEAGVRDTALG
jgi:7-cyano-7-deazaguanine synthase